jgi:hypothetical protein
MLKEAVSLLGAEFCGSKEKQFYNTTLTGAHKREETYAALHNLVCMWTRRCHAIENKNPLFLSPSAGRGRREVEAAGPRIEPGLKRQVKKEGLLNRNDVSGIWAVKRMQHLLYVIVIFYFHLNVHLFVKLVSATV